MVIARPLIAFWLLAGFWPAACGSEVRDVRGYEIRDSGLIGRALAADDDIHWLDADRVLLIGAGADDYVTPEPGRKQRRFRLLIWSPKDADVAVYHDADIAYGRLCVSNGYVRLEYTSDYRMSPEHKRWHVFEGPMGRETLSRMGDQTLLDRRNRHTDVNRHTCREFDRRKLPNLGVRTLPLLEGEFTSQEREGRTGEVVHRQYWPRAGAAVKLDMTPEPIGIERYSRYLDVYVLGEYPQHVVFGDKVVRRSWLMDRSGKERDFTPPSGPWMRGSTSVMPTKAGLLLTSSAVAVGSNGAAGAYLQQKDGRLVRIIAGLPYSFDVASGGCEIALSIYDRRESDTAIPRIKAINVCSKGD